MQLAFNFEGECFHMPVHSSTEVDPFPANLASNLTLKKKKGLLFKIKKYSKRN